MALDHTGLNVSHRIELNLLRCKGFAKKKTENKKKKKNGLNWNLNVGCIENGDQLGAENAGHSHFVSTVCLPHMTLCKKQL